MNNRLELKFLHRFNGIVWNLLTDGEILLIEVRNVERKQVSFSALNQVYGTFLWKDRTLEENWWVNASAIVDDLVIFTVYMDTNNPDKKGVVVYALKDLAMVWWNNDFSLGEIGIKTIRGFTSKLGLKEVVLDAQSGAAMDPSEFIPVDLSADLVKPSQYNEGSQHFQTVQKFLADRLNFVAVSSLEYVETNSCIVISCYAQETEGLANYLFVLSAEGNVLLKEKMDSPVKGIGLDTFFILKGCVIFVRNKVELISYKII